ncbi:hypothetical protein [Micromonospora sp. L31]|uniref:hypothetical protein n=1 Tax=Micromonospora sp. L31 TaxID=3452213 RepID=UPI003F8BAF1B
MLFTLVGQLRCASIRQRARSARSAADMVDERGVAQAAGLCPHQFQQVRLECLASAFGVGGQSFPYLFRHVTNPESNHAITMHEAWSNSAV